MQQFFRSAFVIFISLFVSFATAQAKGGSHEARSDGASMKPAIVLAAFGTTVPEALPGILHIRDRIQQRFPQTEVRVAFTSNMIRKIWHKRQDDAAFKQANPQVPEYLYTVQGPLATIANLQDEGYVNIVVQPGQIALGEEFLDLVSYVDGLNAIRTIKEKNQPFVKLAISRPVLGTMGTKHPYEEDINEVAKALADDAKKAKDAGCALLYLGHGNEHFPSSGSYLQLVQAMRDMYPDTKIYLTNVEGFPNLDLIVREMKRDKVSKVLLKTFMTVAGDHANNDMAGDEPDSVKSRLGKDSFQVTPILEGLGEKDAFADVFVSHLAQTAEDNGISLK
jgi:sirohydrochlorin cobaltochelatase